MTDKEKKKISNQVKFWIDELIDYGELTINQYGEIEYTQEWLNEQLFQDWCIESGYKGKELIYILECFENYKAEKEVEVDDIIYETYDYEFDEIYQEYATRKYLLEVETKKIS